MTEKTKAIVVVAGLVRFYGAVRRLYQQLCQLRPEIEPVLIHAQKLSEIAKQNRVNEKLFSPDILIQREIGQSSWFGFSLVIRPGSAMTRPQLLSKLNTLGFECRPIVTGNFARSEVMKYFDADIVDDLANADHIHANGLFIGNHHYPIADAIAAFRTI